MKKQTLLASLFAVAVVMGGCENQPTTSAESSETMSTETGEMTVAAESGDGSGGESGDTIAIVNGVKIPASRLLTYTRGRQLNAIEMKQVIDNVITSELISQMVRQSPDIIDEAVRQEIIVTEQSILSRRYVDNLLATATFDNATVEEQYQQLIKEYEGSKEYDVAHILVSDEAQARDLIAQIKKDPKKFGALATANSSDPGSAVREGKLGWMSIQNLVPPFAEAMEKLDGGKISDEPVQTQFGWHIIRVDATRPVNIPELDDQLRQQLQQSGQAEFLSKHIESLRETAEIEIL